MNVTIKIGPRSQRVYHHALKLLALLAPAATALLQLSGKHWAFLVGAWATHIVMLALLVLHVVTHIGTERCPHHKAFDPKALRHRLAVRLVKLDWLFIATVVVFTVVRSYFSDPDHKATSITLLPSLSALALYWGGLVVIAAKLFTNRHRNALPEPEPSRRGAALAEYGRRLAHRSHWLVLTAVAGFIALAFTPEAGVWNSARTIGLFLVLAAFLGDSRHSDRLCETCVTEFRVDAPEYAAKRRWLFTVDHRGRLPYMVLLIISLVVGHYFDRFTAPYIANSIATSLLFAAITLVNRFHRKFQPWCPYCRNGGGGGPARGEVPDPTGGHGRPVPV